MKKALFILIACMASPYLFGQTGTCINCPLSNPKAVHPLDGTGSLGMTYQKDTCGLNFVQASVLTETRSAQAGFNTNGTGFPTTCSISGLPGGCAQIIRAYVYYIASYQSLTVPTTTVSITNPASTNNVFNATLIGTGPSKCWGETGTAVYRADVTGNISGNGNYTIDLNGFQNKNWEVDGVTLFIIYRDPLATYQGSLILWDGDITAVTVQSTQSISGFTACAASMPNTAVAFLLASDRQANVNNNQHQSTLNGNVYTFSNDFWCWDQATTTVTSGQTTANYAFDGVGGDCYTWALMGLYYQTNTCVTCTPVPPSTLNVNSASTSASCNQSNGTATASVSGGVPPYAYNWNTSPPQNTQTATGLAPGTYVVNVVDATGCSMGNDTVVVTQLPVADTLVMTAEYCEGDTAAILYAPQGFSAYQWFYDTTLIAGATGDSILVNPAQIGNYNVNWLYNGCVRHTSVYVQAVPSPFFLPDSTANVFTPNGDGKNDVFYPYVSRIYNNATIDYYARDFSIRIYNRWGNLIYEGSTYLPQWDGRSNGREMPDGVYFWVCSYVSRCAPDKAPVTSTGFVHLMR
ncbi:MAG: gliding motility-associated C-terminal domain-containing protein [Bacteroidota bacterium]